MPRLSMPRLSMPRFNLPRNRKYYLDFLATLLASFNLCQVYNNTIWAIAFKHAFKQILAIANYFRLIKVGRPSAGLAGFVGLVLAS